LAREVRQDRVDLHQEDVLPVLYWNFVVSHPCRDAFAADCVGAFIGDIDHLHFLHGVAMPASPGRDAAALIGRKEALEAV
jgi:hypothetical protein